MQLSSEVKPYSLRLEATSIASVNSVQLMLACAAMVLAFVPLVPPVEALEGGLTPRGAIEFGLILVALALLAMSLKMQGAFSFELKSAPFLIVTAFCWWSMLTAIWSPNPILTIAKSAELWCITLAASMVATLALRSRFEKGRLERVFALAVIAVIGGLIVVNVFYWGNPLPSTGDKELSAQVLGESFSEERPRLILAYQHALLSADLIAIAIISLFASDLRKTFKLMLMPCLFALMWLVDARGATIGLMVALLAIVILRIKRHSVRAIAAMISLSAVVAGLLAFQERLPSLVKPFVNDDVLTLNSRTELWSKTLNYIAGRPILGTGYFGSRYFLMKDFEWAGHAHNSFLEVLLTTGLIGLVILVAFLVLLVKEVVSTRNAWLLGITVYGLIQGMVNPVLFNPGLGMFALALALIYAGLRKSSTPELAVWKGSQ